jgi:hypothetical protein
MDVLSIFWAGQALAPKPPGNHSITLSPRPGIRDFAERNITECRGGIIPA